MWNGYGFSIGTRYLNLTRTYADGGQWKKKTWKQDITQPIADRLRSIEDMYAADDANRTFAIVRQIFEQFHPAFTGE
jgi:hypothetical protein